MSPFRLRISRAQRGLVRSWVLRWEHPFGFSIRAVRAIAGLISESRRWRQAGVGSIAASTRQMTPRNTSQPTNLFWVMIELLGALAGARLPPTFSFQIT